MKSIVVTLRGTDRPGLVKLVSDCAMSFGANWADSVMANFAGQFCGAIHLEIQDAKAAELAAALNAISSSSLKVEAICVDRPTQFAGKTVRLELVGNDRPGIVNTISNQLALHGANIVKMNTAISSAPMSGGSLFSVQATIVLDEKSDTQKLQAALEGLADELMVDLTLESAT